MALSKLTKDMAIIQKLDDEPNDVGGLTAAQLKAKFDEAGEAIKTYINDVLIPGIPVTAVCAVTLTASGWNEAAKQQTVTVAGVLAGDSGQLVTPYPADDNSYNAYGLANVRCFTWAANSMTFVCDTIPAADIHLIIKLEETA